MNREDTKGYRTLGHLVKVNFNDKELLHEYLCERLGLFVDSYFSSPIEKIMFSYIERDGLVSEDESRILFKNTNKKDLQSHTFNNKKLPISMNVSDYGELYATQPIDGGFRYIVSDGIRTYSIDSFEDGQVNHVTILGIMNFRWTDTALIEGFKREIGKSTIYFLDGEIVLQKQERPGKAMKRLVQDKLIDNNFIVFDIETVDIENEKTPYLINGYNGKEHFTVKADKSLDRKLLFKEFIDLLLSKIEKGTHYIYAHNLSGFDGYLINIHLATHPLKYIYKPLYHEGKIISIEFITADKKKLVFKDSYLMLPLSLRQLAKSLNLKTLKSYFPYKLSDITYIGKLPPFDLWGGDLDNNRYMEIAKAFNGKPWNFMDESIKYCRLDCEVLYNVLVTFNNHIFNTFQVNINKSLTISALAMRVFRSKFMGEESIYQLVGPIEEDIRKSYTGGAVDVYIPSNDDEKLYYYDVNSLYPSVMASSPVPVGKPTSFTGDIFKYDKDPFGFFYCKITSPAYLEHPILQRRIKTNSGIRTIAGLGTWEGWIFSEELKNALKFDYKFEVIGGYTFKKSNIFSGYVDMLYNLRNNHPKGHALNTISKLLMNSLYGKFAQRLDRVEVEVYDVSTDDLIQDCMNKVVEYGETVVDYERIDNHIFLIRAVNPGFYREDGDCYHGADVNIGIFSAITAYARIHMSQFKNNPDYNLFYSDTDSIVIDQPLNNSLVGKELGLLKLEHTIAKGVFIAPKVYALENTDGDQIIKVKGLSKNAQKDIKLSNLQKLLFINNSLELTQEKWSKKFLTGEISVEDVIYTLKITSNKRKAIYDFGKFTKTEPFNYDDII